MSISRVLSTGLQKFIAPWNSSGSEDIFTFTGGIPLWSLVERWNGSYAFQHLNHGISDVIRSWMGDYYVKSCRRSFEPFMNRKELYLSSQIDERLPDTRLSDYKRPYLPSDHHIRLVHILGGSQDSSISIRFSVVKLSEAPSFETLSYVWGTRRYRNVNCDRASLSVTVNLYEALHALRRADEERVFWIDSLCINQDDLSERAQQVAMMRSIYASSERTAVWLGKDAALSEDALDLLRKLAEVSNSTGGGSFELGQDQLIWEELGQFYANMWFYRIWIIQEVVVAQNVEICMGQEWWKWDDFATTSQFALDRCKRWQIMFDPTPAIVLNYARTMYQTYGPYPTILHSLALGKSSLASLDIDKVYGVLGLSNDSFSIDYKENAAKTYMRLAKAIISRDYASAIFDFVDDHSFRLDRGLPSWVPDWEVRHGPKPLKATPESGNWKASLESPADFKLENGGRRLTVRGFIVDTLDHVGHVFLEETPVSGAIKRLPYTKMQTTFQAQRQAGVQMWTLRRMRQWDNFKQKHARFYAQEELQDAFLRTLTAGSLLPNLESMEFLKTAYATWCRVWIAAASNSYSIAAAAYAQHSPKEVYEATQFFQRHVTAAWYRRYFTTKVHGLMGLCPNLARRHHLVVIVHGVSTPLILRRLKNGTYRFIGQCYVHGIMYGEAMAFEESKNVQHFVLV